MKVFGIYDDLAQDLVQVFLSSNFDTAKRGLAESMKGKPPPHDSYTLVQITDCEYEKLASFKMEAVLNIYELNNEQ